MPDLHSTAGRHAADRIRARDDAARAADRNQAKAHLATRLRHLGLVTFADLTERPNVEPSLAVNCRIETCEADRKLVYAVLDDCQWRIVAGRHLAYGDFLHCLHTASAAELLIIVKVPNVEAPQWEAA